jgi:hypothetical protein
MDHHVSSENFKHFALEMFGFWVTAPGQRASLLPQHLIQVAFLVMGTCQGGEGL